MTSKSDWVLDAWKAKRVDKLVIDDNSSKCLNLAVAKSSKTANLLKQLIKQEINICQENCSVFDRMKSSTALSQPEIRESR